MENITKVVVTLLQVMLWITFLCAMGDPGFVTERTAGSFYYTYAFLIDPLYQGTSYLITPLQDLFIQFKLYNPEGPVSWFPISTAAQFSGLVAPLGLSGIFKPTAYQGVIIWWIPMASVILWILAILFDHFYERTRNAVWNLIIEYIFQRKKTRLYAQALDKRNEDLARLNTQYRTLAQETHSLKDSVITDELTKVFNKRFFLTRLQQEFEACREERAIMSLIMIDIDFFKKLNDTYGHLAGDTVLKAVAAVLKRFVPDHCYPCRYGGEEFSIIMPRRDVNEAMEAARLIQENVQQLHFDDIDKKLRVTVSQGICTVDFACPESKVIKAFDNILELADQELYRSKMEGRNRVSVNTLVGPKI